MSPHRSITSFCFAGLLLLIGLGCEESFPPYEQPQDFTKATLSRDALLGSGPGADTLSTIRVLLHCSDYRFTQIKVALKNIYEETLDGKPYVNVRVEIEGLDPRLPFHRELKEEIRDGPNVTLDPGESYAVVLPWDRRDDDGHLIDTGIDTTYFAKPDTARRQSPPIAFRLRASIQVWKEVPPRATNEFILRLIFYTGEKCIEGYVQ